MEKRERKKDSRQVAVRRGLEALRQWGIATEDLSSASIEPLTLKLGKGHDTDLAIISLLGRISDPSAVAVLTSLERAAAHREIKKEIRRSLFKLSQKGIQPPRTEDAQESRPLFQLGPEIEAYLSSVDGAGGRLVWLAKSQAGRGIHLLQGMVSDREGLVRVGAARMRRKELRGMAQEIKQKHGVTMIGIPWEYGDLILCEGFEKAKAQGRTGIEDFPSLRATFNPARPRSLPHPVTNRLDREEALSGPWRELSRTLLEEPEFRPWVLDEDCLRPYLDQVEEARESRIVLTQIQKEERLAGIVRDASREIFSGESAELFQRRMEDMALYLLETGRKAQARLALAVALALQEGDLGGIGGTEITFLTGLVQKSLAFYLAQAKARSEQEPSLIVKPSGPF